MTTWNPYAGLVVFGCLAVCLQTGPLASQQTESCSISAESVLEIGVLDGDPEYVFGSVQTAQLVPDGRIVVADKGASSIRVYGSDGNHLATMGGQGEGPGEFESIFGMWIVAPDTVRVWDTGNLRITTFLADGTFVGTQKVYPIAPDAPHGVLDLVVGDFSNGDVGLAWTVGEVSRSSGIKPDRIVLGRFGPDGRLEHLLGESRGLYRANGSPVLFTPFPYASVYRDTVYFTNGLRSRIVVRDGAGNIHRTITLPAAPIETSEAWASLERELRKKEDDSTGRRLRSRPRADRAPGLGGMLIDDRGFIWGKIYDPTKDPVWLGASPWGPGGEWWVVTRDGAPVTKVSIPDDVVPLDIRGDLLLGLTRGPLDVERIVVHTIVR